jgi:hypothetical protein
MPTRNQAHDPLLYDFEMPLRATYHPLGFSVEFVTNSHEVLEAAQESWGHFQKTFPGPLLQICVGVLDEGPGTCADAPSVRARRSLMARVADAHNYSMSDVNNGFAFAWLTRATVANKAYLRWYFIEGITWDLLEPYLTPVHAACVRKDDTGILLCGDSGAGKSSLAYACALKGWSYLTDDSCCIVRGDEERIVIGNPYQIRFRTSAATLFPELNDRCPTRRENGAKAGELAFELATAELPGIAITTKSFVDYILFLNRKPKGKACLTPYSKSQALQWLEQVISCRDEKTVNAHKAALRRLVTADILELRYSDLDSAIGELETLTGDRRTAISATCASIGDSDNV